MKTLVILGAVSVQRYVFRSNKLKENVGASYLVKHALEQGLLEQMPGVDASAWHNLLEGSDKARDAERPRPEAEAIYMAGGNAVLLFNESAAAQNAVYAWSKWLLEYAPGLRVAAGMAEVGEKGLADAYDRALTQLGAQENALPLGNPLPALPIVRSCASTGQPAVFFDPTSRSYLSAESSRKRRAVGTTDRPGPAQDQAMRDFAEILDGQEIFPLEMEDLGGSEGQSRVAVVHVDGNDMGRELTSLRDAHCTAPDAEFVSALRTFAAGLRRAALLSFKDALLRLRDNLKALRGDLATKPGIFPLRPLVYGGDDITFVCDARLGLPLAQHLLDRFSRQHIELPRQRPVQLSACAGVAIVPAKFPFARACNLAESLCAGAKARRREARDSGSWLDFQVLFGGAEQSLDAMRQRRFTAVSGEHLLWRPWPVVVPEDSQPVIWADAVRALDGLRAWPRSVLKDFRAALTLGPDATQVWLATARGRGRDLPDLAGAGRTGWAGVHTPYYDCLELLENYLPLAPAPREDQ